MRDLLRHRDARLLVAGQAVSNFGDWLLLLVFGIWVKDLTHSNGAAGAVILAMTLPVLSGPLVGVLVDRIPRRGLLVANDLAAAAALNPLLLVRHRSEVWIIYLVAGLYGLTQTVLSSGTTALLQEMLDGDLLATGNAALSTVWQSMRLVGPLIGAGLYAAGGVWVVIALDAATFLVSAAAFAAVRTGRDRPGRDGTPIEERETFAAELSGGWRHALRDPVLRPLLIASTVSFSCIGFLEPSLFGLVEAFGRPASFVGVVAAAQGAGAVVGGLGSAALINGLGAARVFTASTLGIALALIGVVAHSFVVVLVAVPVAGALIPPLDIAITTALQQRTPHELIGRVSALVNVLIGLPSILSIGIGAALIGPLGYRALVLASAAALLAGGTIAMAFLPQDRSGSHRRAEPA